MKIEKQKEFKKDIEDVFESYSKQSARDLSRSKRLLIFRNLPGVKNSVNGLVKGVLEKGVLIEKALPIYYFLGGFGNEYMTNPNHETWRENSLKTIDNIARLDGYFNFKKKKGEDYNGK